MTKSMRIFVSALIIAIIGTILGYSLWLNNQPALDKFSRLKNVQKTAQAPEQPVAPEQNPPGDIPDSQVLVKYHSPAGGYELQVPEGWARTESGGDVVFVDKLDGIRVSITKASGELTVINARNHQLAELQKTGRAIRLTGLKEVNLASGKAILMAYQSNSVPDPVTGKQARLENHAYLFNKNGKLAALTLWAPLGADNTDQWNLIADSFRW
jgi:hypothetical protein